MTSFQPRKRKKRPGNLPFIGETMTCALCPKTQRSDPTISSQWRYIALEGRPYYVCPDHFPPDSGSENEFADAYETVLRSLLKLSKETT